MYVNMDFQIKWKYPTSLKKRHTMNSSLKDLDKSGYGLNNKTIKQTEII